MANDIWLNNQGVPMMCPIHNIPYSIYGGCVECNKKFINGE